MGSRRKKKRTPFRGGRLLVALCTVFGLTAFSLIGLWWVSRPPPTAVFRFPTPGVAEKSSAREIASAERAALGSILEQVQDTRAVPSRSR